VFVFLNRRRNQVKLILWTRGGFTIVHKRLEKGTFTFPARVTCSRGSKSMSSRPSRDGNRRHRGRARRPPNDRSHLSRVRVAPLASDRIAIMMATSGSRSTARRG
jgi:transposase